MWKNTDRHTSGYRGHPFGISGIFPSTYHQGSVKKLLFAHEYQRDIIIFRKTHAKFFLLHAPGQKNFVRPRSDSMLIHAQKTDNIRLEYFGASSLSLQFVIIL